VRRDCDGKCGLKHKRVKFAVERPDLTGLEAANVRTTGRTTAKRARFVGGGLPRKLAVEAGVPGADLIPERAELFLGFTSTLRDNLGPSRTSARTGPAPIHKFSTGLWTLSSGDRTLARGQHPALDRRAQRRGAGAL